MRRLLSVATAVILAASLSSCSLVKEAWAQDDENELAHEEVNRIIAALNAGDAKALKKEFSATAVAGDQNLDSEIDRLLKLLPDGVWSWRQDGCSSGGETDYGKNSEFVDCYTQIVLDSPTPVYLTFELYLFNTIDPDNVGVYDLHVTTGDQKVSLDDPGLFVSDSPPVVGDRL